MSGFEEARSPDGYTPSQQRNRLISLDVIRTHSKVGDTLKSRISSSTTRTTYLSRHPRDGELINTNVVKFYLLRSNTITTFSIYYIMLTFELTRQ